MRVKLIEGNEVKELSYRPWDGVRYGADDAERIVKQYSPAPFDRSAGAYIMRRAEYKFWETYLLHLAEDERSIREAYMIFFPSDVENYLRRELDLAGDDPRLHHKARQTALAALRKDFPAKARALKHRDPTEDYRLNIRFSAGADLDIIEFMRRAETLGEPRTVALKRLIRVGLQYQRQVDAERDEALEKMRKEGWLAPRTKK